MQALFAGLAIMGLSLSVPPVSAAVAVRTLAAVPQQATASDRPGQQPITGGAINCVDGKILTFDCRNIELLAYLPSSALGSGGMGIFGGDVWGWTDSATNREFAIVGKMNGTAFVEVTDPMNPKYLGRLPGHLRANFGSRGLKVYKNHAFIVVEGTTPEGLQVFDLTQLRTVETLPVEFQETAHYDRFHNAHTLTLNPETGFAYPSGATSGGETCGSGLHMVDVRTPSKPTFAGCYNEPQTGRTAKGYIHDAQCVIYRGPDRSYQGREICFNSAETAISIADVTNKTQPKTISLVTYPNVAYTHQGWLTDDQRYFFLNDELDEDAMRAREGVDKTRTRTLVFDMADLDDPVVLTEFYGTTSSMDHNLYIRGRYMYQANYQSGLRIIDIVDPKNPQEVAYLSTIGSAWTNYPYFKHDVVAVSTNRGLFLVRLRTR